MAIASTVGATVTVEFADDLTEPARKAFERFRKHAETTFKAVAATGVAEFSKIRQSQEDALHVYEAYDRTGNKVQELDVVGNSYVPDMVDTIGYEFSRLDGLMVDPAVAATDRIKDSFAVMGDNVAHSIDDLIFKGEIRFDSFRDFAYQTLNDIQNALFRTATGGQGIGGLIVGGVGNVLGNMFSGTSQFTGRTFTGSPDFFGPGFAHGGAFTVGGSGGTDSQAVRFMATPGERVTVETPEQQRSGGGDTIIHMDLRGSNGSQEIEMAVQKALRKAAPILVNATINKVQDKFNRKPHFLK